MSINKHVACIDFFKRDVSASFFLFLSPEENVGVLKSQTLDAASVLSFYNLNRIFAKAFVLIYVFQFVIFVVYLKLISFLPL